AAADVEHAPSLFTEEELETEARRRMRACAERAARVDDDRNRVARCVLPRRADPERTDAHGPVKGAPPVLPARLDLGHSRAWKRREHAQSGLAVRSQLDLRSALLLLEPLGRQLDEPRTKLLELGGACADRSAGQRKALRSLLMNPSSASAYVPASLSRSNSSSSRRCSSFKRRGTVTLTRTRWSPRPKPCSTGMPRPRSTFTAPGCTPGSNESSTSPSSVGTVTDAPSAACTIVRSTCEKMSFPSRTKRSSGRTRTRTYRSPALPPSAPACPSPERRMR